MAARGDICRETNTEHKQTPSHMHTRRDVLMSFPLCHMSGPYTKCVFCLVLLPLSTFFFLFGLPLQMRRRRKIDREPLFRFSRIAKGQTENADSNRVAGGVSKPECSKNQAKIYLQKNANQRMGNQEGCGLSFSIACPRLVFCLSSFKFPDVQCVVAPAEAEGFDKKFFGKCFLKSFTPTSPLQQQRQPRRI